MKLKVLLIEDSDDDVMLITSELENAGFELDMERVYTRQGMTKALSRDSDWELIISDHNLPGFSSIDALFILLKNELDVPLIIVSGTIGEEMAVEAMKAGAQDFVMKDHLSRLGPAVKNALDAAQAKRSARDYQQRLRELSTHLESVREQERAAIARDIHDEIGGLLTALKMDVRWLNRHGCDRDDAIDHKLNDMGQHLDQAIKCVRRIITDLRPSVLDDLGLLAALEWQFEAFCKRYDIKGHFEYPHDILEHPRGEQDIVVFRIFQESLTNIAKHAKAGEVWVYFSCDLEQMCLEIADNGVGIIEENRFKSGSYGLVGMNERAIAMDGSLQVSPNNGGGTRVKLLLPCTEKKEKQDDMRSEK